MTLYHASDRTTLGRRLSVVNHLKNGGFFVYRQFTAINYADPHHSVSKVHRTQYTHRVTDLATQYTAPSVAVPVSIPGFFTTKEAPKEQTVGYWDVWGTMARIAFNERRKSLDGGNVVGVRLSENGQVFFRQAFHSFDKFRGKSVTFALSGCSDTGSVKVLLRADTGKTVLESRAFYSEYFGPYYRMVVSFNIPLDVSKLDMIVSFEGAEGASVGISGASLCLGAYMGDLPFSESLPDVALPSGTIVAWTGEACPSGFRSIDEGAYLLAVLGDPNAVRGNLFDGGTAPPNGTTNSMGTRGKKTLGEQSHTHRPIVTPKPSVPVLPGGGTPPSAPTGAIIEGRAFGEGTGDTISPINSQNAYVDDTGDSPEVPLVFILTDKSGHPDRTYRGKDFPANAYPPEHVHKIFFQDGIAEPPRLKVRLCEKI